MRYVVLAASGDVAELVLFIIVFIIFVIGSLIKKAMEAAKGQQRPMLPQGGPRPQSTPWEEVRRFLQQAGVQTETRPKPPQPRPMPRPTPMVRPGPSSARRPPAPRPGYRAAPRPTRPAAPRPVMAPAPTPLPPQPGPQRLAAPAGPATTSRLPEAPKPRPALEKGAAAVVPISVLSLKNMTPEQLRTAIVLREVLGPPAAARGAGARRGFLP
ncbi:MAG: hypothetical protein AB1696_10930 [Planctomycetota bacterium]